MFGTTTLANELVAFYATAATVIPVLTIGSILAVAAIARSAARWLDDASTTIQDLLRAVLDRELRELRSTRRGRWLVNSEFAILDWAFGGLGRRFVKGLLLLGFVLPAIGEVVALVALAEGTSSSGRETFVWLGLGMSALLALVPILEVLVFLSAPFAMIRSAIRVVSGTNREIKAAEVETPPQT